MTEYIEFPTFITKGITIEKNDERRIFKGHITAEIIDRQQEFIFVKEVMAIMDEFMKINPVISDEHSNRMVGKVLGYEQSEINGVASVLITSEIYKSKRFQLYDKVWAKICSGEYAGLSMGGASKEREPIEKNGRMALELRKLELYEIAVCKSPANAFAIIEEVNTFAKVNQLNQDMIHDLNGRNIIQCSSIGCKFEKGIVTGTDLDDDKDIDKEQTLKPFDKPEEVEKLNNNTLVNRAAETRSANIGGSSGSPKQVADILLQIPKKPIQKPINASIPVVQKPITVSSLATQTPLNKDHIPSTSESIEEEAKEKIESESKEMSVHKFIEDFGVEVVEKALEEIHAIDHIKSLALKYRN